MMMKNIKALLLFLSILIVAANHIAAGDAITENPARVTGVPASMAQTVKPPQVFGKPRMTQGHPCTLWDLEDIAHYQELLKTSSELKSAFDQLKAWGDKRIQEPLNVPAHTQETDGKWTFPAFKRGYQNADGKWMWEWKFNGDLQQRTSDVSNLGILYAFSGDEKYATFARKLLLALADAYGYGQGNTAPDPNGYDHFEAYGFDGGDTGMFLTKACSGYDLIYNLPSITPEEHNHIERDLFRPLAEHLKLAKYMYTSHGRWGMVCLYGIFISGVTLNDKDLVDSTLYGLGGNKEKPDGGFMQCFGPPCLRDDSLWGVDQKPEDQIVSVSVMISVAEVMWHHGIDLYSYQNMALKRPFDAALPLIMPTPSTHASSVAEYSKLLGMSGINAYEYAFRRCQDPHYQPLIRKLKQTLVLGAGELPSLFDPLSSVQRP